MLLAMGGAASAITPIKSLPYTINSPGSYVLAKDFVDGNVRITILVSNVVLDLGGHTLQTTTASADLATIVVGGYNEENDVPVTNVTIQNGVIFNKTAGCIFMAGRVNNCLIDHVTASGKGQNAFLNRGGSNNRVTNSLFSSAN